MANIIDYLSLTGLTNYDAKIKAFIGEKVAEVNEKFAESDKKSFKYVNLEGNTLKFYTENPLGESHVAAFEVQLPEQDLSSLMQLVKGATENNIAVFDADGQVKDGGLAVTDIATKNDVNTAKSELEESVNTVDGKLTTETTERKAADEAQVTRIAALEGQIVGLSGAMHFKGIKESLPEDVAEFKDGDVIIVGNKEYVFNNGAFAEFGDVTAVSEAITAVSGRMDTAESDLDKLEADHATDKAALEAKDTEIEGNVTALQEDIATLKETQYKEISKEQIDALFAKAE